MDFSWSEEQTALRRSVVEFARQQLGGDVTQGDHAGSFPSENWRKCAQFGIHGLPMPKDFGGSGVDVLTTMLAMEGLGYGCRDNGLIFGVNAQMWSVQVPILRFGSESQKRTYLPRLISGEWIGAHGMTEPDSGSDAFGLSTTAERRGDTYVLHGSKIFVTNAPVADLFVIFGTVSKARGFMGITAFLVERGTPGLSVGQPIQKMGLRTSPFAEVVLSDCEVRAENRLGAEGNGATIFKHSMACERSGILASAVGTMERQLEACTEYAKRRRQFGRPIGAFQSVANRIVDMKVRLETARLLLYKAGWLRSQGEEAGEETAMAKLYLSECFLQSSLDAVQVHGGYGYTTEFELERDVRDAVAGRIYSGTSEIQRQVIARSMGL